MGRLGPLAFHRREQITRLGLGEDRSLESPSATPVTTNIAPLTGERPAPSCRSASIATVAQPTGRYKTSDVPLAGEHDPPHPPHPRAAVCRVLLDADSVRQWMVPDGMTSRVHVFEPHEGGEFRISLTYDSPTGAGKTNARSDTFHGRFARLVPDAEVV